MQITTQKQELQKKMSTLRNNIVVIVYRDLLLGKSNAQIQKDLYKETTEQKIKGLQLLFKALKVVKGINNQLTSEKPSSGHVYALIKANHLSQKLSKESFNIIKDFEAKKKEELLSEDIKSNRRLVDPKIFYLISKHLDCAKDHEKYQGKIYVDEKWKRSTAMFSPTLIKEIEEYIQKNNIMTFQEVTHRPVWMITRPNCRHYYIPLKASEVLNNNENSLIKKYNAYSTQTIKHSLSKTWYSEKNMKNIVKKYEERLKMHKQMQRIENSEMLERDILKDKLMIKKWKKYIKEVLK